MKKEALLFLFCNLCATFSASAQATDDYVYVTDVITNTDLGSNTGLKSLEVKKIATYTFFAYNDKDPQRFYFEGQGALITTKSPGYLQKIEVTGESNLKKSPLQFFVKNTAYTNTNDLYNTTEEDDGSKLSDFTFEGSSNQNLQKNIPTAYRYIAIKNASTSYRPYLKTISLTWQLAYFRSALTVGNLGTLCLPYGIKAEDMDGITAYSIAGKTVENDVVTSLVFDEVDYIEAGKPYIFVAKTNEIALKYCGDKAESPTCERGMYGVFEDHPFTNDDQHNDNYYVIANNIVQAASKKSGVYANCAYIRMDEVPIYNAAQSTNRALIITGEGFTQTDISPTLLNSLPSSERSNNAFDISGRKWTISVAPAITIINGKKNLAR